MNTKGRGFSKRDKKKERSKRLFAGDIKFVEARDDNWCGWRFRAGAVPLDGPRWKGDRRNTGHPLSVSLKKCIESQHQLAKDTPGRIKSCCPLVSRWKVIAPVLFKRRPPVFLFYVLLFSNKYYYQHVLRLSFDTFEFFKGLNQNNGPERQRQQQTTTTTTAENIGLRYIDNTPDGQST